MDIVNLSRNCKKCTKLGKNLKPMNSFKMYTSLPLLNGPNEEVHLDYAGPLSDSVRNQVYILVAIDRYSKYPSAILTKTNGANKILKFLENNVFTQSIPKAIRTDQDSGFKNKAVDQFCKSKRINHIFCSVGDHQGCGLVERAIQTIERKLGILQFEDIQSALKMIIEDTRVTKTQLQVYLPSSPNLAENL